MFHHRLLILQRDTNDIKPGLPMVQPVLIEKKERCLDHLLLLTPMDRFERRAKAIIRTGFDLDEDYDAVVQNNEIQFPDRTAIISLDKPITFPLKIPLRNTLAFFAQNLFLTLHA